MGGDNTAIMQAFADQTQVTFPIGTDIYSSYQSYAVGGSISPFPLDVIIDQDGNIAYLSRQFNADEMVTVIEGLLNE
jgi:peroxiredoxin